MLRSILVPLDGSDFGEHALPLAAAVARRCGATLHLAHVHRAPGGGPIPELLARQTEEEYLAGIARRLRARGPLALETALVGGGDVAAGLRDYADSHCIDLI